jgi:hypothetical protein
MGEFDGLTKEDIASDHAGGITRWDRARACSNLGGHKAMTRRYREEVTWDRQSFRCGDPTEYL